MNRWHHDRFIIDSYSEVSSTNDLVSELAKNNQINHNHIIKADRQTNGHGRYGRVWQSEMGNLYFSLLLRPEKPINNPSLLSFVSAVTLSQTLSGIAQLPENDHKITHKWPNDILINEKKVAGILLQNFSSQKNSFIVIGIGLNIDSHPENTNFGATNLKAESFNPQNLNAEEILKIFLTNFSVFYDKYLQFGFGPIRNLWLKKAFRINQEITANLANQKITGIFKDLDNSGNLILQDNNGAFQIISSFEIFPN